MLARHVITVRRAATQLIDKLISYMAFGQSGPMFSKNKVLQHFCSCCSAPAFMWCKIIMMHVAKRDRGTKGFKTTCASYSMPPIYQLLFLFFSSFVTVFHLPLTCPLYSFRPLLLCRCIILQDPSTMTHSMRLPGTSHVGLPMAVMKITNFVGLAFGVAGLRRSWFLYFVR